MLRSIVKELDLTVLLMPRIKAALAAVSNTQEDYNALATVISDAISKTFHIGAIETNGIVYLNGVPNIVIAGKSVIYLKENEYGEFTLIDVKTGNTISDAFNDLSTAMQVMSASYFQLQSGLIEDFNKMYLPVSE